MLIMINQTHGRNSPDIRYSFRQRHQDTLSAKTQTPYSGESFTGCGNKEDYEGIRLVFGYLCTAFQ